LFQGADMVFLFIYTLEFIGKVYAEPKGYGYNNNYTNPTSNTNSNTNIITN